MMITLNTKRALNMLTKKAILNRLVTAVFVLLTIYVINTQNN